MMDVGCVFFVQTFLNAVIVSTLIGSFHFISFVGVEKMGWGGLNKTNR